MKTYAGNVLTKDINYIMLAFNDLPGRGNKRLQHIAGGDEDGLKKTLKNLILAYRMIKEKPRPRPAHAILLLLTNHNCVILFITFASFDIKFIENEWFSFCISAERIE